jgi:hypothetical protein
MTHDIISDILTADTIPHEQKGRMIDEQLDKLQDPARDVMSLDEWRMMADHMGGVEVMGGRATELVRLVQAPAGSMTEGGDMHAMPGMTPDSAGMAHGMERRGQPMVGMAHDSTAPSQRVDATGTPMPGNMSATMKLHARMLADPVIRQRVMADSVMRGLMTQSAKPPAPAPRPAKPDSSDRAPHDQHSAGAAAAPGRGNVKLVAHAQVAAGHKKGIAMIEASCPD